MFSFWYQKLKGKEETLVSVKKDPTKTDSSVRQLPKFSFNYVFVQKSVNCTVLVVPTALLRW